MREEYTNNKYLEECITFQKQHKNKIYVGKTELPAWMQKNTKKEVKEKCR